MPKKTSRETERRKARQQAAMAAFKKKYPHLKAKTRSGVEVPLTFDMLDPVAKQKIIEGYNRGGEWF